MTFPADLCKVTLLACQATLSTICCILVADILAVAPILWTAPLSCVHVLIMMVSRSISRLSWLPLLGLAQAFGSRAIPENLFQRSLFFCETLAQTSHIFGGKKKAQYIFTYLIAKAEKETGWFLQQMGYTPVLKFKQNCKSYNPTVSFSNGLGTWQIYSEKCNP